jgi:hypothetical protein
MGEEADADLEAGLIEWAAAELAANIEAMMNGPKQRRTALRLRGRSFESVEIDDDGKIIEPVRCNCAVVHMPNCPFYCT